MHTFKSPDSGWVFHCNSDPGRVLCAGPKGEAVDIPFEDMKMLVAAWVRRKKVSRLEEQSDHQILFGEP